MVKQAVLEIPRPFNGLPFAYPSIEAADYWLRVYAEEVGIGRRDFKMDEWRFREFAPQFVWREDHHGAYCEMCDGFGDEVETLLKCYSVAEHGSAALSAMQQLPFELVREVISWVLLCHQPPRIAQCEDDEDPRE